MTVSHKVININNLTINEMEALETVYNLLGEFQNIYMDGCVLVSPNDGEIIEVNELARVKGILSFIMMNRAVEVSP